MLISEAVHKIAVHTSAVQYIHTAAAVAVVAVQNIRIDLVAAVHTEAVHQAAADRTAVADRTFVGSRFGCAAGTRLFPCTRTTSQMPTKRSSRIQSSVKGC